MKDTKLTLQEVQQFIDRQSDKKSLRVRVAKQLLESMNTLEVATAGLARISTHKYINPDGSLNAATAYSAHIAKEALQLIEQTLGKD